MFTLLTKVKVQAKPGVLNWLQPCPRYTCDRCGDTHDSRCDVCGSPPCRCLC